MYLGLLFVDWFEKNTKKRISQTSAIEKHIAIVFKFSSIWTPNLNAPLFGVIVPFCFEHLMVQFYILQQLEPGGHTVKKIAGEN